jgi:hypothetical protein
MRWKIVLEGTDEFGSTHRSEVAVDLHSNLRLGPIWVKVALRLRLARRSRDRAISRHHSNSQRVHSRPLVAPLGPNMAGLGRYRGSQSDIPSLDRGADVTLAAGSRLPTRRRDRLRHVCRDRDPAHRERDRQSSSTKERHEPECSRAKRAVEWTGY